MLHEFAGDPSRCLMSVNHVVLLRGISTIWTICQNLSNAQLMYVVPLSELGTQTFQKIPAQETPHFCHFTSLIQYRVRWQVLNWGFVWYRVQDPTVNVVAAQPVDVVGKPCDPVASPVPPETAAATPTAAALLSPYHTVTNPRPPTRRTDSQCSSSDISSSVVSGAGGGQFDVRRSSDGDKALGSPTAASGCRARSDMNEASSGYESMMRDSEEMTSNQDSAGEDGQSTTASLAARLKGARTFRKRGRLVVVWIVFQRCSVPF